MIGAITEMYTAIRIALMLAFLGLLLVGQMMRNRAYSADLKSRLRANNILFIFLEISVLPGVAALTVGSERATTELVVVMVAVFSSALGLAYVFCQMSVYIENWLAKRKQHQ